MYFKKYICRAIHIISSILDTNFPSMLNEYVSLKLLQRNKLAKYLNRYFTENHFKRAFQHGFTLKSKKQMTMKT